MFHVGAGNNIERDLLRTKGFDTESGVQHVLATPLSLSLTLSLSLHSLYLSTLSLSFYSFSHTLTWCAHAQYGTHKTAHHESQHAWRRRLALSVALAVRATGALWGPRPRSATSALFFSEEGEDSFDLDEVTEESLTTNGFSLLLPLHA